MYKPVPWRHRYWNKFNRSKDWMLFIKLLIRLNFSTFYFHIVEERDNQHTIKMRVENVFPYTFEASVASTFHGSRTNGSLSNYLCTLQLLQRSLPQTLRFLDVLYSSSNPFRYKRTKRLRFCLRIKSEMKYWSFKSTSLASEFICLPATARKMATSCWIV
jgi:hypothetical protein